ncbi:hypothetical protein ABZ826_04165 [Streptomyces sp. NPDC047515]|uniref:hypothetical protein n=1 Tax=Streptomyces sp. NPDC047515 TaxID=3155380 RepID=UPI0033FD9793
MPNLNQAAAMFARMSPQEQREALGALGVSERPQEGPQEPAKVTPFSALVSTPSRRKRRPITVTVDTTNGVG